MKPFADVFPAGNVRHHFTGQDRGKGVYAKELRIPAGFVMVSHRHLYDHLSILAGGTVVLSDGVNGGRTLTGPCAVTIAAGMDHSLVALTDAVWFCVHPTDETNPDAVDATLVEKDANRCHG